MHNALAENEGFCNTNSIEKTDTKSKPTTIREHFFLVVIFLELILATRTSIRKVKVHFS